MSSLGDVQPTLGSDLRGGAMSMERSRRDRFTNVAPTAGEFTVAVLKRLGNIGRLGRSAKIHMLIGLQRADTRFISGEFRDNLGMRVAMSRLSPDGAKMMWDSYVVGTTMSASNASLAPRPSHTGQAP